ncbi:hypothetical protein [Gordoniibacillus kamchatkensis]|nr:hypothetical protein [Paenibacillus sp. VKM B-2647]
MYPRATKRMIVGMMSMLCAAILLLSACQEPGERERRLRIGLNG